MTHALEVFSALRGFFATDAGLAQALDWDAATVGEWRAGRVVRPQLAKVQQVLLLGALCEDTRPFLAADEEVGQWVNTRLPNLRESPAGWLRDHGLRGLRELRHGLVDWMPRLPAGELEPIDEKSPQATLKATADDPGVRELERMLAALD